MNFKLINKTPESTPKKQLKMPQFNVKTVNNDIFGLGESPHWCPRIGKIFFVDIPGNFAAILNLENGSVEKIFEADVNVTAVVPYENDPEKVIVSTENAIYSLNYVTKEKTKILDIENPSRLRFNDAKCDSRGRFWIGSIDKESFTSGPSKEEGFLYKLSGDKLEVMLDKISLGNGLGWSSDDKTMFFVDSVKRLIYAMDYDIENGTIGKLCHDKIKNFFFTTFIISGPRRILCDLNTNSSFTKDEFPDGIQLDADDNIWIAMMKGSRIACINSKTGALIDEIKVQTALTTAMCFGGKNLDRMIATTAKSLSTGAPENLHEDSGKILEITSPNNSKFRASKSNYNFI